MGGSYLWPLGIELGAAFRYNSGTIASKTFRSSGRNLPIEVDEPFEYAGVTEFWLAPDAIGSLQNPSWPQLDLRVRYKRNFTPGFGAEVFMDVFNVLNNQDSIRNEDLVAGTGGTLFGEPIRFLDPRRFFLGARVSF
jgi:outer membrane receptor protein involved in Fe transport